MFLKRSVIYPVVLIHFNVVMMTQSRWNLVRRTISGKIKPVQSHPCNWLVPVPPTDYDSVNTCWHVTNSIPTIHTKSVWSRKTIFRTYIYKNLNKPIQKLCWYQWYRCIYTALVNVPIFQYLSIRTINYVVHIIL